MKKLTTKKTLFLAFFLLFAATVKITNASVSQEALVFHFSFDEGTGDVAKDKSKNGFEADLQGDYKWVEQSKSNGAIEFTQGAAVIPDDDMLDVKNIAVMAWIFPKSITEKAFVDEWWNSNNIIYGKAREESDDSVTLGLIEQGGVFFYIDTGSNYVQKLPDLSLQTDQWYHIAATYDGENMRVYLDGELVGEMPANGDIISNSNTSEIGGRPEQEIWFDGIIDEVVLFNKALTKDEINQMMKSTMTVEPEDKLSITWGCIKHE